MTIKKDTDICLFLSGCIHFFMKFYRSFKIIFYLCKIKTMKLWMKRRKKNNG